MYIYHIYIYIYIYIYVYIYICIYKYLCIQGDILMFLQRSFVKHPIERLSNKHAHAH